MDKELFDELAKTWDDETGFHSNPHIIMSHPTCRKIAHAGTDVLPWCLEHLAKCRNLSWTLLIQEIAGERITPEPDQHKGFVVWDVQACVQAVLDWGKEKGLIS